MPEGDPPTRLTESVVEAGAKWRKNIQDHPLAIAAGLIAIGCGLGWTARGVLLATPAAAQSRLSQPSVSLFYRDEDLSGRHIALAREPVDPPTSRIRRYIQRDPNDASKVDLFGLWMRSDELVSAPAIDVFLNFLRADRRWLRSEFELAAVSIKRP